MEILAVRIKVRRIQRAFRRVNSSGRRSDGESERRVEVKKKRIYIFSCDTNFKSYPTDPNTAKNYAPFLLSSFAIDDCAAADFRTSREE